MTHSEILGLSFLSEKDQLEVLDNFGIVQHKPYGEGNVITCTHPESLADLADRLWRENVYRMTAEHHRTIAALHFNNNRFTELQEYIWWFMDSKSIHRIQVALMVRDGV